MRFLNRNTLARRRSSSTELGFGNQGILDELRDATNRDVAVPIYHIEHDGRSVDLVNPIMLYSIHECGYWSIVGSGVRIFARGDTLEEALDDFASCFFEMKSEFYDNVMPGYEEVYRYYRGFIEGYR